MLLYEKIINISKIYKSIKGVNFIIYTVIVVCGDLNGGFGIGRAKSIDQNFAIYKAFLQSRKKFYKIVLKNGTIFHEVCARFCNAKVILIPGKFGYNIRASNCIKKIFEVIGITSIISKIYKSSNIWNISNAVIKALLSVESFNYISLKRNKLIKNIYE